LNVDQAMLQEATVAKESPRAAADDAIPADRADP